MSRPALELDLPTFTPGELVLLGIRCPYRPDQQEAIAPQAETQGFLRSGEIELVDVERLEVAVAIRLTAITAPMLESHV